MSPEEHRGLILQRTEAVATDGFWIFVAHSRRPMSRSVPSIGSSAGTERPILIRFVRPLGDGEAVDRGVGERAESAGADYELNGTDLALLQIPILSSTGHEWVIFSIKGQCRTRIWQRAGNRIAAGRWRIRSAQQSRAMRARPGLSAIAESHHQSIGALLFRGLPRAPCRSSTFRGTCSGTVTRRRELPEVAQALYGLGAPRRSDSARRGAASSSNMISPAEEP